MTCHLPRHLTDGHPGPCPDPATTTVTARCHRHGTLTLPVCRYHRGTVADGRRVWCGCGLQAVVWLIGGRA